MKKIIIIILLTSFWWASTSTPCLAKKISPLEAQAVAEKWLDIIIDAKGSWGEYPTAQIDSVNEFKRKGRVIGYFAQVSPKGFIIVSLKKGLAPVKAYSAESDLDPESDIGMADLLKLKMEGIILSVEKRLGVLDKIPPQALQNILNIDYSAAWDQILNYQKGAADPVSTDPVSGMNYQTGDYLVSASWDQNLPYANYTPDKSCTKNDGHSLVGCVATAAAQIMYYWKWPPYGAAVAPYNDYYDWANMADRVTTSDPPDAQDAVAELNFEAALAVGMDFGCDVSFALYKEIAPAFSGRFRYSGAAERVSRISGGFPRLPDEWFSMMQDQFNLNRPVQYTIVDHSILADGWRILYEFNPPLKQYHMNYGWDDASNAWYVLDELYQVNPDGSYINETMVRNIFPAQSLLGSISGIYSPTSFPYYYFDRDTVGGSVRFDPGLNLQFLEGAKVTNTTTVGGFIRFEGNLFGTTRLFTGGDTSRGARIDNGIIKLSKNGSIKLH